MNYQQKGKVSSEELKAFPSSRKITLLTSLPVSYHLMHVLALYAVLSLHIDKPLEELFKKVQLLKKIKRHGISKDVVQNYK